MKKVLLGCFLFLSSLFLINLDNAYADGGFRGGWDVLNNTKFTEETYTQFLAYNNIDPSIYDSYLFVKFQSDMKIYIFNSTDLSNNKIGIVSNKQDGYYSYAFSYNSGRQYNVYTKTVYSGNTSYPNYALNCTFDCQGTGTIGTSLFARGTTSAYPSIPTEYVTNVNIYKGDDIFFEQNVTPSEYSFDNIIDKSVSKAIFNFDLTNIDVTQSGGVDYINYSIDFDVKTLFDLDGSNINENSFGSSTSFNNPYLLFEGSNFKDIVKLTGEPITNLLGLECDSTYPNTVEYQMCATYDNEFKFYYKGSSSINRIYNFTSMSFVVDMESINEDLSVSFTSKLPFTASYEYKPEVSYYETINFNNLYGLYLVPKLKNLDTDFESDIFSIIKINGHFVVEVRDNMTDEYKVISKNGVDLPNGANTTGVKIPEFVSHDYTYRFSHNNLNYILTILNPDYNTSNDDTYSISYDTRYYDKFLKVSPTSDVTIVNPNTGETYQIIDKTALFDNSSFIKTMQVVSDRFNTMFENFYYKLPIVLQLFFVFIFDGLLILILMKVGGFK